MLGRLEWKSAEMMVTLSTKHTMNTTNFSLVSSHQQNDLQNASQGCEVMNYSEMEFLPWDNPDNIVSAKVEEISRRVKNFILVFLFLIGGPGNVISMAVFYKQGLKDRVNLCLFALSLADELYLIMSMFYHAEQVHLQFTTKETYGPMMTFLENNYVTGLLGFTYVSQVLSAIIATERCLCVINPLKFQALMKTRTMAIIIFSVYVVVLSLHFIVVFRLHIGCVYDPASGVIVKTVVAGDIYRKHKQLVDYLDGYVFGAILPTLVVIVVIATTKITVVKLRQVLTWRAETSSSISARDLALTKMLVGNSILFLACAFPNAIIHLSWLLFPEMNVGRRHHNFFLTSLWFLEILTYINSSFNILVYYAMGSRFRETCRALFVNKQRLAKQ